MHGSADHNFLTEIARSKWAQAATLLAVVVALILISTKVAAWIHTGSATVLGSLADSLLDLLGSLIAFGAVRYAAEPADTEHRFGHNKAEPVASVFQFILIVGSALYVMWESGHRFFNPRPLHDGDLAMWAMGLSLILSTGLVAFQSLAMKKSGSIVVEGDRAHYLGDLLANLGGLVAIILATHFGMLRADAIAGLLAGLFLLHAALSIARKAVPQLMDEELSKEQRRKITEIIMADPDSKGVHALRTRRAGQRTFIRFHLELDPQMNLMKSHEIADRIEKKLLQEFAGSDVMIHQDPHGMVEHHDKFGRRILDE